MSTPKSVEQQLKEAIEASKQTLALSEQVTTLAQEKETLSKRLAEIESALSAPKAQETVAVDPLVITKLGELFAERELTAKAMNTLQATVARLEKEAAKKADLNEYVKQKREEGEEGETPAEKINDSGKGKAKKASKASMKDEEEEEGEEEACDGDYGVHGSKAKKAAKSAPKAGWGEDEDDDEDYGDLSDEEIRMIKEYRQASTKISKKADATLKNPTKEEDKNFDTELDQPGLDPKKNNVNENNTTSPGVKLGKKAAKAKMKGETDVEEIMESPDQQKKEDAEGGEEKEEHETTLSKPGKGAKKAEEAALEPQASKAEDSIPPELMEYLKELVKQEKQKKDAKKGENSIGGVNKQDVTGQPDQDEEESFLKKKEGKKAEAPALKETLDKCIKEGCDNEDTKVHGEGCAPTAGNKTEVGDKSPLAKEEAPLVPQAKQALDSVVDVAVERLAQVAKQKAAVEAELAKKGETLASEIKAKDEALTAVAQLQAKFEAMMAKLHQAEAKEVTVEAKAAKLMAASAVEPVAAEIPNEAPQTDADILAKFEAIADAREKNRYFKANASAIARASQVNLKRRS
jgi:hypothetical protein